jgi:hypothetical protein
MMRFFTVHRYQLTAELVEAADQPGRRPEQPTAQESGPKAVPSQHLL